MATQGRPVVLLTGASMGIGEAIATCLVQHDYDLILLSRSEEKLSKVVQKLKAVSPSCKVTYRVADVSDSEAIDAAVASALQETGRIDILINNAGLALGAPASFNDISLTDVDTMVGTNVNGMLYVTHSVLNRAMRGSSDNRTILNITSITGLEVPPFPGEAVYHASKAFQEAFTNALRNELSGTNIRVLALRPGCVATNFHSLRVDHDKEKYDAFFEGFWPLEPKDIASAAVYMLQQPLNVSIKALDVVPSAQRSINVFDRQWSERNKQ